MWGYRQDRITALRESKRKLFILALVSGWILFAIGVRGAPEDMARLTEDVKVPLGDRQVSLARGTSVQVLRKDDQTATIGLQLSDGSPLITKVPIDSLNFISAQSPPTSSGGSTASVPEKNPSPPQTPVADHSASENPTANAETTPDTSSQNPSDADNNLPQTLPTHSTTLEDLNAGLPPKRYTQLRGYFYILINGLAVPVVYSLPMEDHHLAKSASNLIFYGPYPNEQTMLTGNIVPQLVEKLGCSVFSITFKQSGPELSNPKTAYWGKESPWFPAILAARDEIIKGFGLERKKLILMGYSGGGGMVLNFTGAYPDQIEAVAAQGANLAPDLTEKNNIKWLIINNRGERNATVTLPFYDKLQALGCTALYCETTPERGRGNYHSPSGQAYNLIYSFIAGIITQRSLEDAGTHDLKHLWPYVAPKDQLKRYAIAKTSDVDETAVESGAFDLLPSVAFALNWSRVCAPTQTIKPNQDLASLHVTFPACSKPTATVLYYAAVEYQNVARVVEDINSLAEHGYVVISPSGAVKPDTFAKSADSWINSQDSNIGKQVHLVGYGRPGSLFIASFAQNPDLNVVIKSISLVNFENSPIDQDVRANIESLAKTCNMFGFFLCSNDQSNPNLADWVSDLVTTASQERGCAKLLVTRKMTPDALTSDQDKVSADMNALNTDFNNVALDNDKCKDQGEWSTPQDQDQGVADQMQWELDQAELKADQVRLRKDQGQAATEEKKVEDQALTMVKALIDRSVRL